MSDERNVMKALVKLAICPGDRSKCAYCAVCSHSRYGDACANELRKEYGGIFDDLGAFLAEAPVVSDHTSTQTVDGQPSCDLQQQVTDIIHDIGMPAHVKGYRYAREAIILAVCDANYVENITKWLYPAIAKQFDTTPSRVERAIRHAIEIAWDRSDFDVRQKYFGYTISSLKGKPTNSEFISMIADHIRLSRSNKSAK